VKSQRPSRGVCSWSLQPESAQDLAEKLAECRMTGIQLALDPVRRADMPIALLRAALEPRGIHVLSGMMAMEGEDYTSLESIRRTGGIVPDDTWDANVAAARYDASLARELGLTLVTFHAGFVPHESGELRTKLIGRLRRMADIFGEQGCDIALETGQEDAVTLRSLLEEVADRRIGVNFDPANMILYGMGDPVAAVRTLTPWIRQVHIKDAVAAEDPGVWGAEVPAGQGDVDWPQLFRALRDGDVHCDTIVEREGGDSRVEDVITASDLLDRMGRP
jgi:L-ribulose-5-phosphate 3-epimerase